MMVVVGKDRGVVRWNRDGIRKAVPFPDSGNGRAFMNAVDEDRQISGVR
jgi:hypothetical protein